MFYELEDVEFAQQGMVVAVTQIQKTESGIIGNTNEEFNEAKKNANPLLQVVKTGPGCSNLEPGDKVFFSKNHIHSVERLDWVKQPKEGEYYTFPEGAVDFIVRKDK